VLALGAAVADLAQGDSRSSRSLGVAGSLQQFSNHLHSAGNGLSLGRTPASIIWPNPSALADRVRVALVCRLPLALRSVP
jgi:hypothetical protein